MSGRGAKVAVGLLGLVVLIAAAAFVIAGAGSPTEAPAPGALDERSTDPPSRTNESTSPFQDVLALAECFQPEEPVGISQTPAPTAKREIDRIARAVEELRGLQFERDFKVDFLPAKRLAARAVRISRQEYTPEIADTEARMLTALGAIPRSTNLRKLTSDLIESQVAGFYIPEQERLVVPGAPDEPLGAFDRTILAHELEHALADQNLDLPLDEVDPEEADENTATLSVVEGDATLTMQQYTALAVSALDSLGLLGDPRLAEAQAGIERIPHYLVRQLAFPYETGLEFVCDLYMRGGWDAVDRAYRRAPSTTAQVMFPQRYHDRERAAGVSRARPPAGFSTAYEGSFGAAQLLWLFEAPGNDPGNALDDPEGRAAEWAGGTVRVFTRGESSAVSLRVAQRRGANNLCSSIERWYDAAFTDDSPAMPHERSSLLFEGGAQTAVLSCRGGEVRLGIAARYGPAADLAGL